MRKKNILFISMAAAAFTFLSLRPLQKTESDSFITHIVDPQKKQLRFFWKDENGKIYGSIQNLRNGLEKKKQKLVFAMNGGMYMEDRSPLGLYIENGKTIAPINNRSGNGNFYLQPNGIFYLSKKGKAVICKTENFVPHPSISYATQSGPMLLVNGKINPNFKPGSANLNIRNGVGILPNGEILFAMSKQPVNFYNFALYFKNAGCANALYLDGFVSRTYLPEQNWLQTDGDFGVMIGEVVIKE